MPHCGQGRRRVLQVDRGTHGIFDEMEAPGSIADTLIALGVWEKKGARKRENK